MSEAISTQMRILAAIVTFNRRDLLSRCIDQIQNQTRQVDDILVINNGSTDDTLKMLTERGIDVISQPNLGSAGGWNRAIRHCLDFGYDAIWLMDDDGFPDSNALDLLVSEIKAGISCASSVVVQENRPEKFVFPFPMLDKDGLPVICSFPRKLKTLPELRAKSISNTYPFAHLFNGALIQATAIRQIGNVNPRYFLAGDEIDYFFRLRSFGPVVSVLAARHFHPDVSARPFSTVKTYYYIRNSIILNRRYFNNVVLRDCLTLIAAISRVMLRNGIKEGLSYLAGRKLSVLLQAVRAGLEDQLGSEFHG